MESKMESVFLNASLLISADGETPDYDCGVCEMVCTLVGLETYRWADVLAYLRSVRAFEAEKARLDSLRGRGADVCD